MCHTEEVNSDGIPDLLSDFNKDLSVEEGTSIARLKGETVNGAPIRGEDSIRIVPSE